MRIAFTVGDLMMPAVCGAPADAHALARTRAEDGKEEPERAIGFEGAMGKEAMETDCHAVAAEGVHDDHGDQLWEADADGGVFVPEQDDTDQEARERTNDGAKHHDALKDGHAIGGRRLW